MTEDPQQLRRLDSCASVATWYATAKIYRQSLTSLERTIYVSSIRKLLW